MLKKFFDRPSQQDSPAIKKITVVATLSILMIMFGVLAFASEYRVFFYRPAAAVSILSEYTPLNNLSPYHTQVWKVVPETGPDGSATLRFFPEAATGADAVCVLSLPSSGSTGEIVWKGIGKSKEKRSVTGLLVVSGFPVPCDVLPIGGKDGAVYQEKAEAGGRIFSRIYRVSYDGFDVGKAKSMGWIKEEPAVSELIMVTVTDEKGQLTVRQLWPAGGSWWLYEETPLRRSWLIE